MTSYDVAVPPWLPPPGGFPEQMVVSSQAIFADLWPLLVGLLVASGVGLWLSAHGGARQVLHGSAEALRLRSRKAGSWLVGHARLIEAHVFIGAARRLAREGDVLAAENELEAAMGDAIEAAGRLPARDRHLARTRGEIRLVAEKVQAKADELSARIESTLARSARLLDDFEDAVADPG